MFTKLVAISGVEPVTLDQAKVQLGLIPGETHDHDGYITALITAARERAEQYTGRSLVDKTIELNLTDYPTGGIYLPGEVVKSIVSVKVLSGEQYTETTDYFFNNNTIYFKNIPALTGYPDQIKIQVTYKTGYGSVQAYKNPMPETIKQAILMMVRTMYDNRDDVVSGKTVNLMPRGSEFLLNPYRTFTFQ